MQHTELVITRRDQARALQDSGFLGRFLEPASPSDVARSLGIPANLAHHHAKRHARLGLLNEVRRQGGKVYYQLAARTFKYDRSLLPIGDEGEPTSVILDRLRQRFRDAYEACERAESSQSSPWTVFGFDRRSRPATPDDAAPAEASSDHPAHLQVRTVSLTSERYHQLVRQIAALISAAEAEHQPWSRTCTLAFLAMENATPVDSDSNYLSTFVPMATSGLQAHDPGNDKPTEPDEVR